MSEGLVSPVKYAHPADKLDEVGVQGDTGLGIEDRRLSGANEVGRDNLVLGVTKQRVSRG